jgi:preprotein translocase subunit SecA
MNDQRKIVYGQRRELMDNESIKEMVEEIRTCVAEELVLGHLPSDTVANNWDFDALEQECKTVFDMRLDIHELKAMSNVSAAFLTQKVIDLANERAQKLEATLGDMAVRHAEKSILLRILDQHWKDHLLCLDHIRHGINLRAYAQGNPLNEYKREAFNQFTMMMSRLKVDFLSTLHHFKTSAPVEVALEEMLGQVDFSKLHVNYSEDGSEVEAAPEPAAPSFEPAAPGQERISRNSPCPCNSGKKFKHCHGALS